MRSPGADEDFLGPVPGSGRHVYGAAAAGDERRKAPVPGADDDAPSTARAQRAGGRWEEMGLGCCGAAVAACRVDAVAALHALGPPCPARRGGRPALRAASACCLLMIPHSAVP